MCLGKEAKRQIYPQNIETDVRAPEDTNPADEEYLGEYTKRLCNLKSTPVILPLFKQLHGTPEEDTITEEPCQSNHHRPKTGKMNAKLLEILRNDPKTSIEEIVQLLSFSDTEQKQVERTTVLKAMAMWIRQGLSQLQSAKEFSPTRKHLIRTQLKIPKSWQKQLV